MTLQKFLHAIPSSVPDTAHYVSAYLKLTLTPHQINQLNELTTLSNNKLFKNYQNLKAGTYDTVSTTFNPLPCTPIKTTIPYENLLHTQIYPKHLELDSTFPINYNFIAMNIQTNSFHVSLLPIIRFTTQSQSQLYLQEFKTALHSQLFKPSIDIQFKNDLIILPKFDYSKFFLALQVHKSDHLMDLITNLYNIRSKLAERGLIIGEFQNQLLQWENSIPHMSFGVCNIHQYTKHSNNNNLFGTVELSYLNNVLLDWTNQFNLAPVTAKLVFVIDNQHLVYG